MALTRSVGIRLPIAEITNGNYVETSGQWESNYVDSEKYGKITRVVLYGIISSKYANLVKEFSAYTVDDLTGEIRVVGFKGMSKIMNEFEKDDIVLIVGKIKKDQKNELYISPEIIKKVNIDNLILNTIENF
ncbi:OB-fold nucleic acid binding domain-containing protein [Methanococcus voltae]|uniref:Nucleic acid binding OB-fold tRNA/helicase-type n=1 Tax=Methanococcus voltae (strain ATCC BAA-1334 / A3) TaxID=456320 RepID=D7DQN8_METV3|nr:OB-fold nucleic acid binding domain-containing protein [Methanococcus voltae]MCS3901973.1 RPA family protein [Methanococcus voltae]